MSDTVRTIRCARCGETRKTVSLWAGFKYAPDAEVVCCLIPNFRDTENDTENNDRNEKTHG